MHRTTTTPFLRVANAALAAAVACVLFASPPASASLANDATVLVQQEDTEPTSDTSQTDDSRGRDLTGSYVVAVLAVGAVVALVIAQLRRKRQADLD